jgi:two-component system response regulator
MAIDDQPILLVEDDPDAAALTVLALRRAHVGNTIVIARDGGDALDHLFGTGRYDGRDPLDTPALVLLDLELPRVDGLEVLRRVRDDERTRHLPVVILTASDDDRDRTAGFDLGANAFVPKPVAFADFVDAIRRVGIAWLLLAEAPKGAVMDRPPGR